MSDKEWYEGLTVSELEGKHVLVTYDEGCVVSGRMVECNGDAVIADGSCDGVGVLWRDGDGLKLDKGVRDFRLVWDERDWEQIDFKDLAVDDAVVVNGCRIQICETPRGDGFVGDIYHRYSIADVSCSLRRRSKLPTEPGFYRDGDGTLLIRLDYSRERWMFVSGGFSASGAYVGDEVARKYLPLTPVHFVDGRAE